MKTRARRDHSRSSKQVNGSPCRAATYESPKSNLLGHRGLALVSTILLCLLVLASAQLNAQSRSFTFSGDSLAIANLIGAVEIVQANGSDFTVEATVRGKDSSRAGIVFDDKAGTRSRLIVGFPVDKHNKYVYPEQRGRVRLSNGYNERSSLLGKVLSMLGSDYVQVSGSGSGLEVWVDLVIGVPKGGHALQLENGVGAIDINQVDGDLKVDSHSGALTGNGLNGRSRFDLGSGRVKLSNIQGEMTVDTGSGSVSVDRFEGPVLMVDTGSGQVNLNSIRTRRLGIDTGSGGVSAEGVSADEAMIDTGSGSVRLALTEMGPGDFSIDTGSGAITLLLPDYASAKVDASTGSGGIDVALEGVKLLHRERDEMRFEIGKGAARVTLDTGSGGIRIAGLER